LDGLSRGDADIQSDVESVGLVLLLEQGAHPRKALDQRALLGRARAEPIGAVSSRDE
jgi:hypothetical protein